jgi:hypothetical protein
MRGIKKFFWVKPLIAGKPEADSQTLLLHCTTHQVLPTLQLWVKTQNIKEAGINWKLKGFKIITTTVQPSDKPIITLESVEAEVAAFMVALFGKLKNRDLLNCYVRSIKGPFDAVNELRIRVFSEIFKSRVEAIIRDEEEQGLLQDTFIKARVGFLFA